MVQTAQDRTHHYPQARRNAVSMFLKQRRHVGRWLRDPWAEGHVRAPCIIVWHPLVQETPQVVLGERDQEVQALPATCAQEPLTHTISLGTAQRSFQDPETEVSHLLIELLGENAVAVMDQETVTVINRHGFAKLLHRPLRRGVRCHIAT